MNFMNVCACSITVPWDVDSYIFHSQVLVECDSYCSCASHVWQAIVYILIHNLSMHRW